MDHLSELAMAQIREQPVLADVNRNANRGDVLRFTLDSRLDGPVQGIFAGFVEQNGQVRIELRSAQTAYIDPTTVAVLCVNRFGADGFFNDYRSRTGQGAPKGGPSI